MPASKETVTYFAVAMSRELTPSTVRVYLSAVILMHKIAGFSDPTHHNFLLKVVLKGAKRIHSLKPTRKRAHYSALIRQGTLPDTAYKVDYKERSAYAGGGLHPCILRATTHK